MKIEDLIALRQSITQGDWCVSDNLINLGYALKQAGCNGIYIGCIDGSIPASEANAKAAALVPQLLKVVPELMEEMIKLREALRALIARHDTDSSGAEIFYRASLTQARAALANDK